MRKAWTLFLLLIVSSAMLSVSRALLITSNPVKNSAVPGANVSYRITISNNEASAKDVYILTTSAWQAKVEPVYTSSILPGESKDFIVYFTVPADAERGKVVNQVEIIWDDESTIFPFVSSVDILPYGKIFIMDFGLEPFDPRQYVSFNYTTNNLFGEEIEAVLNISFVKGQYLLHSIYESITVRKSLSSRSIQIKLPDRMEPGDYDVTAEIYYHGTLDSLQENVSVIGYIYLSNSTEVSRNIFGKRFVMTVTNDGTLPVSTEYSMGLPPIDRYLMSSKNGEKIDENIVWEVSLSPSETQMLAYRVTYLPIWIVPIILLFVLYLVYRVLQRVSVTKSISEYSATEQGLKLKIELKVRNIGKGSIHDMKVFDNLPSISNEVVGFGTVQGRLIKRASKRAVYWHIEEIKENEEILLYYDVNINIGVFGDLNIAPADVEYTSVGRTFSAKSNSVVLKITKENF